MKTSKVKLCSGGTPDPSLGYSIQKLAFTNKGEKDFANLKNGLAYLAGLSVRLVRVSKEV